MSTRSIVEVSFVSNIHINVYTCILTVLYIYTTWIFNRNYIASFTHHYNNIVTIHL